MGIVGAARGDFGQRSALATALGVEALEEGAGEDGLDATAAPAIAFGSLGLEQIVAPLAGDALAPLDRALPDDNAAADPGAEDHPKGGCGAASSTEARLG